MKKRFVSIILVFFIGVSITVTAATVFNSKDISYSSSLTTKKNVKDSLDELYTKLQENETECPDGYICTLKLGDYVRMTPTSTSYTISKDLTGYTSDQTINPSELNLWQVININNDGTIDMISVYTTSKMIWFNGETGYLNFTGVLQKAAEQYSVEEFTKSMRVMNYTTQTLYCANLDICVDEGELSGEDMKRWKEVSGETVFHSKDGTMWYVWDPSRYGKCMIYKYDEYGSHGQGICSSSSTGSGSTLVPVAVLDNGVGILSGAGTKDNPYLLRRNLN